MAEYNAAFFKTIENLFLILREEKGEKFALAILSKLMRKSLTEAYVQMGGRPGSGIQEFIRCVGTRDEAVGLKVEFVVSEDSTLTYRFHLDPFPGLKGRVDPRKLDATYMDFKVDFFFGSTREYRTTQHIWEGSPFTEHVIRKK